MENLVKKAKSGDSGAFAQLIRMNTQSMYKVAWAYLKNDEDVADAIQETILKCYEKLSTLKKDSYFKTWMIRILINNCNEMLRKMVEEMGADMPVVEFKTYKQYSELLMDIYEAVADNFEYALKYTANKKNKDFSDFEITEVFILE